MNYCILSFQYSLLKIETLMYDTIVFHVTCEEKSYTMMHAQKKTNIINNNNIMESNFITSQGESQSISSHGS